MRPIDKLVSILVSLYWNLKTKIQATQSVYITTEDFTSTEGKQGVRVAHIWPNTNATYDPDIIRKSETDKDRYIPAVTPRGGITGQGYYDTVERVFHSAFPPVKGDGTKAGDYNIGW